MNQKPVYLFMFHGLKPQSFQCSHYNMLHFKDETVQSDEYYFSYCFDSSIKLPPPFSMLLYLKNLFKSTIQFPAIINTEFLNFLCIYN